VVSATPDGAKNMRLACVSLGLNSHTCHAHDLQRGVMYATGSAGPRGGENMEAKQLIKKERAIVTALHRSTKNTKVFEEYQRDAQSNVSQVRITFSSLLFSSLLWGRCSPTSSWWPWVLFAYNSICIQKQSLGERSISIHFFSSEHTNLHAPTLIECDPMCGCVQSVLKLVQASPTRWNSSYLMIARNNQLQHTLQAAWSDMDTSEAEEQVYIWDCGWLRVFSVFISG
jgi:hypothetical protein